MDHMLYQGVREKKIGIGGAIQQDLPNTQTLERSLQSVIVFCTETEIQMVLSNKWITLDFSPF